MRLRTVMLKGQASGHAGGRRCVIRPGNGDNSLRRVVQPRGPGTGRGLVVGHIHGVDSEVGRLRTVLAHRPGAELLRVTPRTRDRLRFPGQPWLARAQQEHDIAAQRLRDHGAEVLYVMELLQDVMEYPAARAEAIVAVLGAPQLGERLRADLGSHLAGLDTE